MTILLGLSSLIWLVLLLGRGGFWLSNVRDTDVRMSGRGAPDLEWPGVTAIVPARNEAEVIARVVASLAAQDYPGPFSVLIVDDQSTDGTAERARDAAAPLGRSGFVEVLRGRGPERGWTGKLFALQQGFEASNAMETPSRYVWLTDADITYSADALTSLVKRAEAGGYVLTSLMAKLRCESLAERLLIPAFIFFFQMLYPFSWVNRASNRLGAAAGGCMLVQRDALKTIGGFAAIRGALIDDCTLGQKLKSVGPIWLGLTDRARSIRPYERFKDIRQMVARSAYAQLRYSPLYLAGTVLGMLLIYAVGPLAALFAGGWQALAGLGLWLLMALIFTPTLRFYGLPPFWGLLLPLIALIYLAFTLDSAYQHSQGRGGMWKGRAQAARSE
ncbi:MAG: glycosyltransferase [Beijerinckiaceae bacterium]|nr:glycosyltransferase [Beijerinckiaceae bacterium]